MGSVPSSVAVFYGQVDRTKGWYWTETVTTGKSKTPIIGPFETKSDAVQNALQSVEARRGSSDLPGERGVA
jgi:hypothetical protein